jgi:L-amino acid N-acyltransferase YncA
MQARIRAFTPQDYPAIADVYNASWEGSPTTVEQLRTQDETAQGHRESTFQRYVVEYNERIVAFGCYDQPPRFYEPGTFRVIMCVEPRYQKHGIGSALSDRIIEDLRLLNTRSIWVKIREDMLPGLRFVKKHGFSEELRIWELHLDTTAFDPHPYTGLHPALKAQGIEIKTLQELETDAEHSQKLYRLTCEVGQDLPPTEHWTQPSYDDFLRDTQLRSRASYFVAVHEDSYVGLSYLTAHKEERFCATGLTGVKRAYRRQGIALALKLQGIIYTREHAYPTITTSVDSSNQASLSMNERLGFVKWRTWMVFAKTFFPQ